MDSHLLSIVSFPFDFYGFDIRFSAMILLPLTFFPAVLHGNFHINLQIFPGLDHKKSPQESRLEFLRAFIISLNGSTQLGCILHYGLILSRKQENSFERTPCGSVQAMLSLRLEIGSFCFQAATKTFDFVAFFVSGRLEMRKGDKGNGSRNSEMVQ